MAAFGENFDLVRFRQAYETRTDMKVYNQAQVVEPALGRVQNYVADLSIAAPSSPTCLSRPAPTRARRNARLVP